MAICKGDSQRFPQKIFMMKVFQVCRVEERDTLEVGELERVSLDGISCQEQTPQLIPFSICFLQR